MDPLERRLFIATIFMSALCIFLAGISFEKAEYAQMSTFLVTGICCGASSFFAGYKYIERKYKKKDDK